MVKLSKCLPSASLPTYRRFWVTDDAEPSKLAQLIYDYIIHKIIAGRVSNL
jgi:hypothetical protein